MESFKELKEYLLEWIKDKPENQPIKLKLKPGEICSDVVFSIKNSIYQIEQVPPEERRKNPISVTAKQRLVDIYQAIQEPENFDLSKYLYSKKNWFK